MTVHAPSQTAVRNGHPYDDIPPPPEPSAEGAEPEPVVDGASFILDQPSTIPAVWGESSRVLWAEGEACMIAGGQGLGKTTLAGQLVRALLGIGDGHVLGLPVTPQDGPILYLAMDRPRQIARSLARQFTESDRTVLGDGLLVRPGPPAVDMAAQPLLLTGMAAEYGARVVIIDSLKDAAIGLSDDHVGAAYNRARQALLHSGTQLLELHHVVKRGANPGGPIKSVADIYGSTWLTSGAGSVVMLHGEPGDPIIGFRHVKQPAEEVGPWRLLHDPAAGLLTVEHTIDLLALVRATGADGLTARTAAQAITESKTPTRAEVEKARRRLTAYADDGVLVRLEAGTTGGADAWFLAENRSHEPQR